jgi:hypothetical protein
MDAAANTPVPGRGSELLLEHCFVLDRPDEPRPPAVLRLERLVGARMTRLLVAALAGDHRMRSRDLVG